MRITRSDPELPEVERGRPISVSIDGQLVGACEGETVAAVLLAQGIRTMRHTLKSGRPRSIFCGMGVCYDCLVTVNGERNVRACMTPVAPDMAIETRAG